jgi:putative transposase
MDQPPREVYAALLTEGRYLCSWPTMYRILRDKSPVLERRNQRQSTHFAVPRLIATAPNQVWSWDISKLPTFERQAYLSLYVVLDLFSRYVVAWMVAARENSALAKQLLSASLTRYNVEPGQLILHQDRGAPMTSHGFTDLLAELGIERSYSRPRVSNDKPFSESHFRTTKYQPDYPGRFRDIHHARRWCDDFFNWYNRYHHHTSLALFTPHDVFFGRVEVVARARQEALTRAYQMHPERFVGGPPRVKLPAARVCINPSDGEQPSAQRVLDTPDEQLATLWPTAPSAPLVLNVPDMPMREGTT